MGESVILNKSSYLQGVQCKKALMLNALHPELVPLLDAGTRLRMELGKAVGKAAQERYPGGRVARTPTSYQASLDRTQQALNAGENVIYEAAFEAQDVRVVVDILVRGERGWRLIEVKSTTRVKPEHLWDVAIQYFVLTHAGLEIKGASLLHLNGEYVRSGELDPVQLFTEVSCLEEVLALQEQVEVELTACQSTLAKGVIPEIDIGPYCTDPVECPFKTHCWKDLPQPSVFDIYYIGRKAFDLYAQGIQSIDSVPNNAPIDKRSQFHVHAHKAGMPVIERDALESFLNSLSYPLFYLDFETIGYPLPPYDGLNPYAQLPFQYSLHVQPGPGSELEHRGFLARPGTDPRPEFLARLLKDADGTGDIIVYHRPFEQGVLAGLARAFPSQAPVIEALSDRLVDLLVPFRKRWYWHPQMGGSNSLKDVLPVFAGDLSYTVLEIQHGEAAMQAFFELGDETDPARAAVLREALWAYCELDTLAMVRILEGLRKITG